MSQYIYKASRYCTEFISSILGGHYSSRTWIMIQPPWVTEEVLQRLTISRVSSYRTVNNTIPNQIDAFETSLTKQNSEQAERNKRVPIQIPSFAYRITSHSSYHVRLRSKRQKMVLFQEYLDESSSQDSFVVTPVSPNNSSVRMNHSNTHDSFIPQWTSELETIQERPRRLSLTSPNVSSPLPLSMDVFGEDLDSLDAWAEEDVFQSSR